MPIRPTKRRRTSSPHRSTPNVEQLQMAPKAAPRRNPRRACKKETQAEIRDRLQREWRERMWKWVEDVETPSTTQKTAQTAAQRETLQPAIKAKDGDAVKGTAKEDVEDSQPTVYIKQEEASEDNLDPQIQQEESKDIKAKIAPGELNGDGMNDNLSEI